MRPDTARARPGSGFPARAGPCGRRAGSPACPAIPVAGLPRAHSPKCAREPAGSRCAFPNSHRAPWRSPPGDQPGNRCPSGCIRVPDAPPRIPPGPPAASPANRAIPPAPRPAEIADARLGYPSRTPRCALAPLVNVMRRTIAKSSAGATHAYFATYAANGQAAGSRSA